MAKFYRAKRGSQLLLLSSLVASSTLLGNNAYAETAASTQVKANLQNESSLIKAIGNDPMVNLSQKVDPSKTGETAIIHQINQELVARPVTKTAEGVSSVSQLSDVRPTDWAFTALQSLVERYGCIAGYPDSTFRGKQATSRYEFAAGLNACLDKINEIISAGLSDKVSKEDLATLQKLQEEFAAELATLRGRVDALDAKTAKLEAQQFSTTTKLYGQAIFGLQGRTNNTAKIGGATVKDTGTNVTFGQQVQLNLVTQFTDRSLLLTGLQVGNLSTAVAPPDLYALNNGYTRLGYEGNTNNTFVLSDLTYRFLPTNNLAIMVGARGVSAVSVFRGPNRVEGAGSGPLSQFAQRNPIIGFNSGQAGVGFDWQINGDFSLQGVYSAGDPEKPTGDGGLFGGNTSLGLQLAANLFDSVDWTLYYLNSTTTNGTLNNAAGDNIIGSVILNPSRFNTNAFGSTVAWNASKKLTLGGWLGFSTSSIQNAGISGTVETLNWMAFSNFLDTFREGDLLGLYVGQPPKITSSNLTGPINFPATYQGLAPTTFGGQPTSTTHVELFYRYPISKNISITPGVIFVFNPAQSANNETVTIGALRTTFSF